VTTRELAILLRGALGPLTQEWEMTSGFTEEESFMVIRFDDKLKKGHLRRLHALIEDTLAEHVSEGDRC
jgi:hypothetical protein